MGKQRLCDASEVPAPGELRLFEVAGREICLANDGGRLSAVDNACPHRQGPLAEGMLENGKVLCPWHGWAFDLVTGEAEHQTGVGVGVYPVHSDAGEVSIDLEG